LTFAHIGDIGSWRGFGRRLELFRGELDHLGLQFA
jgi:hypothetical protein